MGALLPLLLQAAPLLLDLIQQHHGPLQDFFSKLPIGGASDSGNAALVAALHDIAAAIRERGLPPHQTTAA